MYPIPISGVFPTAPPRIAGRGAPDSFLQPSGITLVSREAATSETVPDHEGEGAMRTIEAGMRVKRGHYLNLRTWAIQPVAIAGTPLAGRSSDRFIAIPILAAFVLAPFLGALFLMFLPVIGFWLTAVAASRPFMRLVNRIATAFAATMEPGWEPGLTHLTGKRAATVPAEPEAIEEDPLDVLEREITARRTARASGR